MDHGLAATATNIDTTQPRVEFFHETAVAANDSASSGFSVGGIYDINQYHHLLFSAGKGLQGAQETNQLSTFAAYLLTF
jgi:hypothetical protein